MGVIGDLEPCWLVLGFVRDLDGYQKVKDGIMGGFQGVLDPAQEGFCEVDLKVFVGPK